MGELQKGAGNSSKSFEFFKTQIGKLTDQMVELEKESAQWKEKSDVIGHKLHCFYNLK